mmetsp:Transcript_2457/g.7212  ORF Transcript_2457/g.7212 Transcript_2457/m.7212 type:complete len:84 (-) Transcript_2457:1238-1489(-)
MRQTMQMCLRKGLLYFISSTTSGQVPRHLERAEAYLQRLCHVSLGEILTLVCFQKKGRDVFSCLLKRNSFGILNGFRNKGQMN